MRGPEAPQGGQHALRGHFVDLIAMERTDDIKAFLRFTQQILW